MCSESCPPCVKGGQRGDCSAKNRAGMTTLPSALFNRLPRSRRRKERRRQRSRFLPTMAKPQFAVRAHHTVVMRITHGSPPYAGEAREEDGFPLGGSSAEGGDEGDGKETSSERNPSSVTS